MADNREPSGKTDLPNSVGRSGKAAPIPFWLRIYQCVKDNIKPAFATIRFLLLIMLPVSFAVLILESTGLLFYVSKYLNPLMHFLGLPGEAALAFLSSIIMNLYSAIAVIRNLDLTGKQLIILSVMCLIAHNFFVECTVMKKTGSSLRKILFMRLVLSILMGWILSNIIPEGTGSAMGTKATHLPAIPLDLNAAPFLEGLFSWLKESLFLVFQTFLIVFTVMLFQRIFSEFGILKKLEKIARPFMGFFGLSPNTTYVWIIAYTIGIAYGAGVIVEEMKRGTLTRTDADLFNHHAAISHAQIEDPLLFVSLGVPYLWAALPRFLLAIAVVWLERVRRAVFRSSFKVKVV